MGAGDERSALGARLLRLRAAAGLDHEEAAARIGVNPRTVRRWEQGKNTPRQRYVPAICRAYDCHPSFLLTESPGDDLYEILKRIEGKIDELISQGRTRRFAREPLP